MFRTVVSTIHGTMLLFALLVIAMSVTGGLGSLRVEDGLRTLSERTRRVAGTEIELVQRIKDIQISVIQVQQWLTDISATRGLDGLDDGPAVAGEHARLFASHMARARELAEELGLGAMLATLQKIETAFPAYFSAGKAMAAAYVAGGPAAGNPLMTGFDSAAETINRGLDGLLAELETELSATRAHVDAETAAAFATLGLSRTLVLALCGVALAVTAGLTVFLIRRLVRPILLTTDITRRLSQGEEDVEVSLPGQLAELRLLASGLTIFRDNSLVQQAVTTAVESNVAPMILLRPDASVILANRAFSSLWARLEREIGSLSEGSGAIASRTFRGLVAAMNEAERLHHVTTKKNSEAALEIPSGKAILELKASVILNRSGRAIGHAIQVEDVTQVRNLEREFLDTIHAVSNGDYGKRVSVIDDRGFTSTAARGFNQVLDSASAFMSEMERATGALAAGDLTSGMNGTSLGSFAVARTAFNTAVTRLRDVVQEVREASSEVQRHSDPIASGSQELARRTEAQAAALEQTSATMTELAGALRGNADLAQQAAGLSARALGQAEAGSVTVTETVDAVSRIARSSGRIADIVTVIDGIAFQTNLLALNAAVEAARAGEAGKGFAVVASEVRQLAQRSGDAAREVRQLIDESTRHVGDGVQLVNRTGATLTDLLGAIRSVAETISTISRGVDTQSADIAQVLEAVRQMDETTQSNAILAEKSAASADTLSRTAAELAEVVATLRTDTDTASFRRQRPAA